MKLDIHNGSYSSVHVVLPPSHSFLQATRSIVALALIFILTASCSKKPSLEVRTIADDISKDMGSVLRTCAGSEGRVIVFEEYHNSRIGQVEIATMLTRLHRRYSMNQIGLEGSVDTGNPLPPYLPVAADPDARHKFLRKQLTTLEISGVEYVSARWPNIKVFGTEKADEYDVLPGGGGEMTALLYLAQTMASEEKLGVLLAALKKQDRESMIAALGDCHPWIAKHMPNPGDKSFSMQNEVANLREIIAKVETLPTEVQAKVMPDLKKSLHFYEIAETRSSTMAAAVARMAATANGEPVAMIIGAAHSEKVMTELEQKGISAALISPKHLEGKDDKAGMEAFGLKSGGLLPGDEEGSLARILNEAKKASSRNRKPPPSIGDRKRDGHASAIYAAVLAAELARKGDKFPDAVIEQLRSLPGIRIHENTIKQIDYDVVFSIDVEGLDGKFITTWVRTGTKKEGTDVDPITEPLSKLDEAETEAASGGGGNKKPPNRDQTTVPDGDSGKGPRGKNAMEIYKVAESRFFESEAEALSSAVISDI